MIYRRDETGKVYADGGFFGIRGIDDQRSQRESFDKLLIRRAAELRRRHISPLQLLALEEDVYGFDAMVARRLGGMLPRRSSGALSTSTTRPRARFQHRTPAPPPMDGPPSNRDGYRARGLLVARESFSYRDPSTHKIVKITAGRTHCAGDCHAVKVRPDAFMWAA
jgi:hypothetical protein